MSSVEYQLADEELQKQEDEMFFKGLEELKKKGITFKRFRAIVKHWVRFSETPTLDDWTRWFRDYAELYSVYTLSIKSWCEEICFCERTLEQHGHSLKSLLTKQS